MNRIRIIGTAIAIGIAISLTVGYFVYANPTNNPWDGMTCDEMMNLAMSPEHHTFTEQQHMQFHMELEPCVQNRDNMHP